MLSTKELKRYNRHIILSEIGLEGQEKLKTAKVLVIGAGGLGCPVLQYLAAAGVGCIGIVDHDVVDESNLQRQVLYNMSDVGFLKAERAAEKVKMINPFISVKPFPVKLSSENALEILREFDLVIDGSDNFPTRYLVNDACVILNKPLVFGSIFKFEGQVTVFNYKGGPTYRCLFPEPPKEGEVPNCSQIGVFGVLPGLIGSYQASEAIKLITGVGEVLSGKLFVIDTLSMASQVYKFSKIESHSKIDRLIDYEAFCSGPERESMIRELEVEELEEIIARGENVQLIDVREDYEVEICSLPAVHIPLSKLNQQLSRIDKEKTVILYCHHGGRSAMALKQLQDHHGFTNLYNLKGGIHQWALRIDAEMATY